MFSASELTDRHLDQEKANAHHQGRVEAISEELGALAEPLIQMGLESPVAPVGPSPRAPSGQRREVPRGAVRGGRRPERLRYLGEDMTLERQDVFVEINDERTRQDAKWGGPEHDKHHTVSEWRTFIVDHAFEANDAANAGDVGAARQHLVEVAALAVAAIETLDRISPPKK